MGILADIDIDVTAEEVVISLSQGRRDATWMIDEAKQALNAARDLWEPMIVFGWFRVAAVGKEMVALESMDGGIPVELSLGPHAGLMAPSTVALVSVNTIGEKLDGRVRALNHEGRSLAAYLLDSVGVVALSKVGDAASSLAEAEAECRRWGVGPRLSPGSLVGWPVEGQHQLCALLDLEAAGLRLTEHAVIIPFKSASGLIGLGPKFNSKKVGSVCRFCMHRETCWRRRE